MGPVGSEDPNHPEKNAYPIAYNVGDKQFAVPWKLMHCFDKVLSKQWCFEVSNTEGVMDNGHCCHAAVKNSMGPDYFKYVSWAQSFDHYGVHHTVEFLQMHDKHEPQNSDEQLPDGEKKERPWINEDEVGFVQHCSREPWRQEQ